MKVTIIQLAYRDLESREERFRRVERLIEGLKGTTELILLPELWNIGYFSFELYQEASEPLHGETVSRLALKAQRVKSYIFTGSFIEENDGRLYNTSVLLNGRGEVCAFYRKMHLFGYDSSESRILTPGEDVVVTDTDFGKIGLSICYDLRFPELFRCMVDMGAEIILNCSAWPYVRKEHWIVLNRARAIENQCYFLSCGCAGSNKRNLFTGKSMVVGPWGELIENAGREEELLHSEINPKNVFRIRKEFPVLKDRVLGIKCAQKGNKKTSILLKNEEEN